MFHNNIPQSFQHYCFIEEKNYKLIQMIFKYMYVVAKQKISVLFLKTTFKKVFLGYNVVLMLVLEGNWEIVEMSKK